MGIQNLMSVLKSAGYEPETVTYGALNGSLAAVDGAQFIARHLATAHRRHVEGCSNENVVSQRWDRGEIVRDATRRMLEDIRMMLSRNVAPVIVLDGLSLDEKAECRARRAAERARTSERESALRAELSAIPDLEEALDRDASRAIDAFNIAINATDAFDIVVRGQEKKKGARGRELVTVRDKIDALRMLSSRSFERLSARELADLESLLAALGISVLEAPDEGERLCAFMCSRGIVDVVITSDSDVIAFGAPRVLRSTDAFSPSPGMAGTGQMFELSGVLRALGMTHSEFIDLCILLGTDFNAHIPRVGAVGARKLHAEMGKKLDARSFPEKHRAHVEALKIDWCREFFGMRDMSEIEIDRAALVPNAAMLDDGDAWKNVPEKFHWAREALRPLYEVLKIRPH